MDIEDWKRRGFEIQRLNDIIKDRECTIKSLREKIFLSRQASDKLKEANEVIKKLKEDNEKLYNRNLAEGLSKLEIPQDLTSNILESLCVFYNISFDDVIENSNSRIRYYVEYRKVAFYLLRKYTKRSFRDIGRLIGSKNHSTVIYSHKFIKNRLDWPEYSEPIEFVEAAIAEGQND